MKTRSKKSSTAAVSKKKPDAVASTVKTLQASVLEPPQIFVLPEGSSSAARIATIPHPASSTPARYLVCPDQGFYEFTRIAAPKRECRSWLLAPERRTKSLQAQTEVQDQNEPREESESQSTDAEEGQDAGYALQTPDVLIATSVDPLFMILPSLAGQSQTVGQEYLSSTDYVHALAESSPHLRQVIESDAEDKLKKLLERRMEVVCDYMDMGDEKLLALSIPKLAKALVAKAKQMSAKGLPASMEDKFVRQALDAPVLGMKREESSISIADEEETSTSDTNSTAQTSQHSDVSQDSTTSEFTSATSISQHAQSSDPAIADLLRLRVALTFLISSYIPARLHGLLWPHLADAKLTTIDFSPLDAYLANIASLKQQAQALRSLGDNISRKRSSAEEDDELAVKKRKKEVEEEKKKTVSLGVRKLAKADTSGMKKLSAFFTKKS